MTRNENMIAVGLEALPGTFLGTFGVGHLYTGRIGTGLAIMVSYWALQAVNVMLMPFGLGVITGFLTLLAYLVFAPTNLLRE